MQTHALEAGPCEITLATLLLRHYSTRLVAEAHESQGLIHYKTLYSTKTLYWSDTQGATVLAWWRRQTRSAFHVCFSPAVASLISSHIAVGPASLLPHSYHTRMTHDSGIFTTTARIQFYDSWKQSLENCRCIVRNFIND